MPQDTIIEVLRTEEKMNQIRESKPPRICKNKNC